MHWRAIGFDLDGTLFDHVGAAEEAVSEFVADLGCEPTAEHVAAWFTLEATHFESCAAGLVRYDDVASVGLMAAIRSASL